MFAGMAFFFLVVTFIPEVELAEIAGGAEEEVVDPSKLTVAELKAQLKARNVAQEGYLKQILERNLMEE